MFNAMKMDFIRMKKSRSSWVILAMCFAIVWFMVYTIAHEVRLQQETREKLPAKEYESIYMEEGQGEEGDELDGMEVMPNMLNEKGEVSYTNMLQEVIRSRIFLLLLSIFTALFVGAESKSGYIKNIAGLMKSRGQLAVAKLPSIALYNMLLIAVAMAGVAGSMQVNFGTVDYAMNGEVFVYLLVQIALHIAFCSVILKATLVFNSTVGGLVFGVLMATEVIHFLFALGDKLLQPFFNENFHIYNYVPSGNISVLFLGGGQQALLKGALVAVVFLVASVGASAMVMNKRDC